MLLPDGAPKCFFLETDSICMDFIRLQWLAAGNYVEFCIRAKTEFSHTCISEAIFGAGNFVGVVFLFIFIIIHVLHTSYTDFIPSGLF